MLRNIDHELRVACLNGLIDTVEDLLAEGANPNTADSNGNTALHCAAHFGSLQLISMILENEYKSVNIHAKGWNGRTALHVACAAGNASAVALLLAYGANMEDYDEDENAPIHSAVHSGVDDVVCQLFDYGCDMNIKGWYEWTALHFSVDQKKTLITESLLDKGASVNIKNKGGMTPLHLAVDSSNLEILEKVLEYDPDIDLRDSNGESALHIAANKGDLGIVQLLLNAGANPVARGTNGTTPIHYAAFGGHDQLLQLLLQQERDGSAINPNIQDDEGDTPLLAACEGQQNRTLLILIENKAEPSISNHVGQIPIHIAANTANKDMTELLLDFGQRGDIPDQKGITALHLAAKIGHQDLIATLCTQTKDININATDEEGYAPIHYACKYGNYEAAQMLLKCKSDPSILTKDGKSVLHFTAELRGANLLQALPTTLDVDQVDKDDNTAIHIACRNGNLDVVRALCTRGANCALENKESNNPLHLAASYHWEDGIRAQQCVAMLLRNKADPNRLNMNKRTALMLAAERGLAFIVEELCRSKVTSKNVTDENLDTALHFATMAGHANVVGCLLDGGASPFLTNRDGRNPVHVAAMYGRVKILILLSMIPEFVVDKRDRNDNTALHLAAEHGHVAAVNKLLDLGANTTRMNKKGQIPLHLACKGGHNAVVLAFCMRDADPEAVFGKDHQGNSVLHVACLSGHKEVVKTLLTYGALTNDIGENGWTAFHCAIMSDNVEMVAFLSTYIEYHNPTELMLADIDGNTSLHIASIRGNIRIIDLLLKAGLNLETKNLHGEIARQLARDAAAVQKLTKIDESPLRR